MSVGGIMQFLLSELLDRIAVLEFPNAVAMRSQGTQLSSLKAEIMVGRQEKGKRAESSVGKKHR